VIFRASIAGISSVDSTAITVSVDCKAMEPLAVLTEYTGTSSMALGRLDLTDPYTLPSVRAKCLTGDFELYEDTTEYMGTWLEIDTNGIVSVDET